MAEKTNSNGQTYGSLNRPNNPVSYPTTPSSLPKTIASIPSSPKQDKRPK